MLDAETRTVVQQVTDTLLRILDQLQPLELRAAEIEAPVLGARTTIYQLWYYLHQAFPDAFTDVDLALDRLLAADPTWHHTAPVLGRPRPDLTALLAACEQRLATSQGDEHRQLSTMKEKLEQAIHVNERARSRAQQRSGEV